MTKRAPRKASLTQSSNPQVERTARRIARQQKVLEKELLVDMGHTPAVKSRAIRPQDLIHLEPLTDTQRDFFESYAEDDVDGFVLYGSAGTGKSFLAIHHALQEIMDPQQPYKRLVILRSVVEVRGIGFLPGDISDKYAPYIHPYMSICSELFKRKDAYEKLENIGTIEFLTTTFLRGETFRDCIVVFDEAQNTTFSELNTVITRVGENCKIIICGDGAQNDLTKNKNDVSGFREFIEVSRRMPEFRHFRFTSDDVVRQGFVKSWIQNCEKLGLT